MSEKIEKIRAKETFSKEEYEEIFPYKYRPLIEIVGDIHTDSQF